MSIQFNEDGHPSCLDNALRATLHWSNRDEASQFMDAYCQALAAAFVVPTETARRWCETAAKSIRSLNDHLWRSMKELDKLDEGVRSMRAGEMLPPPPDVCIEGIEPIKWGGGGSWRLNE